jgi:hypothetical protein
VGRPAPVGVSGDGRSLPGSLISRDYVSGTQVENRNRSLEAVRLVVHRRCASRQRETVRSTNECLARRNMGDGRGKWARASGTRQIRGCQVTMGGHGEAVNFFLTA